MQITQLTLTVEYFINQNATQINQLPSPILGEANIKLKLQRKKQPTGKSTHFIFICNIGAKIRTYQMARTWFLQIPRKTVSQKTVLINKNFPKILYGKVLAYYSYYSCVPTDQYRSPIRKQKSSGSKRVDVISMDLY